MFLFYTSYVRREKKVLCSQVSNSPPVLEVVLFRGLVSDRKSTVQVSWLVRRHQFLSSSQNGQLPDPRMRSRKSWSFHQHCRRFPWFLLLLTIAVITCHPKFSPTNGFFPTTLSASNGIPVSLHSRRMSTCSNEVPKPIGSHPGSCITPQAESRRRKARRLTQRATATARKRLPSETVPSNKPEKVQVFPKRISSFSNPRRANKPQWTS